MKNTNAIIKAMTSTDLILKAIKHVDFQDFCDVTANPRQIARMDTFFSDDPTPENIKKPTLLLMWRFYVAYVMGFEPYSIHMHWALEETHNNIWQRESLLNLINEQKESQLALIS